MRLEGLKFKTEDKDEITIIVDVFADFKEMEFRIADVMIRPYRKRNATSLKSKITDEYKYRSLGYDKREDYLKQEYSKYVTEKQMEEALTNVWQSMKPKEIKIQ